MYDEAVVEPSEQDFSDDEQEKEYKRIVKKVKNSRKRKRRDVQNKPGHVIPQENAYRKRDIKNQAMNQYHMSQPYNY